MLAISRPGTGLPTIIRIALALVAAVLLLAGAGAVRAADAHACAAVALPGPLTDFYNVDPSCFEGGDGNLTQDVVGPPALFDWDTVSGETIFSDPTGDPGNEGQFITGSKEQDPTSWEIGATEPSASKADITAAASKIADVAGDKFLYLAFQTRGDSGSVNASIELNKTPALWDNGTSMIPTRSQGDLLITYDGNQQTNTQRIGLCIWKGDREGQGSSAAGSGDFGWHDFDAAAVGNFGDLITGSNKECAEVGLASAVAGVNDTETLSNAGNTILAAPFLETLEPDTFGELSINLSSLFGENDDPCFDFGGLWLHTREGNSVSAAMEDYLKPKAIQDGGNCGATLDKKVAVGDADGPTGEYVEGTDADPSYANDGDTLWYSIAITNTGSVTFEPNVDELGCVGLVRVDPDSGDLTFDKDDTWTYRCKHVLVEGDPEPYVNTACVTGAIGSFVIDETLPGTCDSTDTHRNPKLVVTKKVTNDSGGTAEPGDFAFTVTQDGNETSAAHNSTTILTPGVAYGVTETTTVPGYAQVATTGDCSLANPLPGMTYYCEVENDDIAPQLTVIKVVNNFGDEDYAPSDFTMHIVQPEVDDQTFGGAPDPGETRDVKPGTYSVSESGEFTGLFTASYGADCAGTIALGDTKTCTVTNTRDTGTITVIKRLEPAGDPGRFNLLVDGTVKTDAPVGDQGTTGPVEVATGDHSVAESAAEGTNLGDYVTRTKCDPAEQVEEDRARGFRVNPDDAETAGSESVNVAKDDDWVCVITNRRVAIDIDKQTTTPIAYNGDTLKYTYRVTNPGGEPLSDVTVTDDKCTSVVLATKNGDTSEGTLDPGDTWDYTCEQPAPTTDIGAPPLVNTATATGTDRDEDKVTDTDTAQVEFRHPKIDIKKTGPATAVAGELITYTLVVTNPGDTRFDDGPNGENGAVVVTDPLCQAPPKLLNKDGDKTAPTSVLDPGDAWTYTCQVQTQPGQTAPVVNTAFVKGTDTPGNKVVESSSAATTVLSPPAGAVSPVGPTSPSVRPVSRAKLSGTVGCAASKYARASVSGSQISRVTYYVNGKKVKTLTKPNAGRTYELRYLTKSLKIGSYKVRAKVEFTAASGSKAKNLSLQFSRCKPRAVKPTFTG